LGSGYGWTILVANPVIGRGYPLPDFTEASVVKLACLRLVATCASSSCCLPRLIHCLSDCYGRMGLKARPYWLRSKLTHARMACIRRSRQRTRKQCAAETHLRRRTKQPNVSMPRRATGVSTCWAGSDLTADLNRCLGCAIWISNKC
jgi:hypothetical protein